VAGTAVTFTAAAAGGIAPYQFKWWVYDGTAWWVAQDWGGAATFTWRPTASGSYLVAVWVRNAGVLNDASQAMAQVSYSIAATSSSIGSGSSLVPVVTSLTTTVGSPLAAGTATSFTANVSGGITPYQYKWWIYNGRTWILELDWNGSGTLNWQPVTPGDYIIAVWVRNAGVSVDASQALAQIPFVVN
jgi:hypothetical protein